MIENTNKKTLDMKVLSGFTDKHTDKKYKKGDVIKGITEERFKEILLTGKLVEAVGETTEKTEKK